MRQFIVAYDVVDDRVRLHLARLLLGQLDRVQKSVFEGPLEDGRLETLRAGIRRTIEHETDSVRIYRLCQRCQAATEVLGTGVYVERAEDDFVV